VKFIRELLEKGPVAATDAEKVLKANEVSERTASRARKVLGVIATRRPPSKGPWWWSLPPDRQ
jgi:hypothetical protein